MLYSFFISLIDNYSFFNVFKYLTVRTGLSMITSMVVVFAIGSPFINYFSRKQIHNPIREDGPEDHIIKKIGTPTMGGVLILIGLFSGILLWSDLNNPFNEGFIIYWEIIKSNNKQLIFKKRLTKIRALNKLKRLQKEGWTKTNFSDQAA